MALTDGLVSYYKFDGDATDSVGTNNGTVNGATQVSGKINSAYSFNGSNNYIRRATFTPVPTSTLTLGVWIKTNSTSNQYIITQGRHPQTINGEYIFMMLSDGTLNFWDYNGNYGFSESNTSIGTINDGIWHYITFVKNGTSGEYYIDGVLDTTVSAVADRTYIQDDFTIGVDYRGSSEYFNGIMDEIGVWDRALSSSEITELYNSGAGLSYPFTTPSGSNNNFFTLSLGAEF